VSHRACSRSGSWTTRTCATAWRGFLREAVPLTVPWLEPRVALVEQQDPALIKRVRALIAAGEVTSALGRLAAPVVALEAARRKGVARQRVLAGLFAPAQPQPEPKPKLRDDVWIDCGMSMQLVTPLGRRFATAFIEAPATAIRRRRIG
jgi:hypothetical protein